MTSNGETGVGNHVRFMEGGWRKATCSVCHTLVPKWAMDAHAIYHVARNEGQERRPGLHAGHNDLTVLHDADGVHVVRTGWITESTGPR